jgi:AraC-like DNA-binding protein
VRDEREVDGAWASFQTHATATPSPDLAPFVARYWIVRWDLRGQEPYRQLVTPFPQVHLSFVDDQPGQVRGVVRGHGFRTLAGAGRVIGAAFRPGGFRPYLGRSVSTITGRVLAADELFGALRLPDAPDDQLVRSVEALLRRHRPDPDPTAERVAAIVAQVESEPGLTTVEALAARTRLGIRTLQRLFAEYVGVSPKWVIRRYRLHGVTQRLAAGREVDWAAVAAELGYADQAHLSRDFRGIFGESPTHYARRYPPVTGSSHGV